MALRSEFYALLADPGPESWRAMVRLLDDRTVSDAVQRAEAKELRAELKHWPPEVERAPPKHWLPESHKDLLALCLQVREVDLYRYYIDAASTSHLLRLRDGRPAVRLQRTFTGSLQGAHGRMHRIGVEGQGDLAGSLCVEWLASYSVPAPACLGCVKVGGSADPGLTCALHGTAWRRLSVALEVEVKVDGGRVRDEQKVRDQALRARGEIYLLVRRAADMVAALVEERRRILAEVRA